MIPYGRQSISEADISAVIEVLKSDYLTQGPAVERFEDAVKEYVGSQHAVAFSSCTAALHAAAWASGLGPGDIVYTSPLTFIASANAARFVGATPGLIDVSPQTFNIDLTAIPSDASAIIPVHFAGLPVDLSLPDWGSNRPVIIEDAAHALGAQTPDGPVGNCKYSDMTCFSFHPVKPITTGEGGMVTTNDSDLAERLKRFRSHGIVRKSSGGGWFYEINELGYHYRMTDIQAALGSSQIQRIDDFIASRNNQALRYRELLKGLEGLQLPPEAPAGFTHGYHLFVIRVEDRRGLYDFMISCGIGVQVHYVPVHHHPISNDLRPSEKGWPHADSLYEQILSIPIHPALGEEELETVCLTVARFLEEQ